MNKTTIEEDVFNNVRAKLTVIKLRAKKERDTYHDKYKAEPLVVHDLFWLIEMLEIVLPMKTN